MANVRQEIKELREALKILREIRESSRVGESVMLKNDLMEINTRYSDRFVELQDAIPKRSAKKKAIGDRS